MSPVAGLLEVSRTDILPEIDRVTKSALDFGHVEVMHGLVECDSKDSLALLPRALSVSNPAYLSILLYRSIESPFGKFLLAQIRLACLAGITKRSFILQCVTDSEALATTLKSDFGLPVSLGALSFSNRADQIDARVALSNQSVLELTLYDPHLMPDIEFPILPGLHLAKLAGTPQIIETVPVYQKLGQLSRGVPQLNIASVGLLNPQPPRPTSPIIGAIQVMQVSWPAPTSAIDPEIELGQGRFSLEED